MMIGGLIIRIYEKQNYQIYLHLIQVIISKASDNVKMLE
jgi:hypothetical protein